MVGDPVSSSQTSITSFGYDHNSNQSRITNANNAATWTKYNLLDLPAEVQEPSTAAHPSVADRTWKYSYDKGGLLTKQDEPGGIVRLKTYDEMGRMTAESAAGPYSPTRSLGYNLAGGLVSVGTSGGTQAFSLNDRGLINTQSGPQGSASFSYDSRGLMTSRTDIAGTTSYGYTTRQQLASLHDAITGATFNYTYTDDQKVSSISAGTTTRTFSYDTLRRLSGDQLGDPASWSNRKTSYTYDNNDNIVSKKFTFSGTTPQQHHVYTYDQSNRLSSWSLNGASPTNYSYDPAGNRTGIGSEQRTFDARNRLLTSTANGGTTYSYGARGTTETETSSAGTTFYKFDAFNRMVGDSSDTGMGGSAGFVYDSLDRLVKRNSTTFSYDGYEKEAVADGTFTFVRSPDGTPVSAGQGTTKLALMADTHGDLVGTYNPWGSTQEGIQSYDPFGKSLTTSGFSTSVGYQGSWTNLASSAKRVNAQTRWYTPGNGQFASRDSYEVPFTSAATANRYAYGNGNPSSLNDPTGQNPLIIPAGGALVRGGIAVAPKVIQGAKWAAGGAAALWGVLTAPSYGPTVLDFYGNLLTPSVTVPQTYPLYGPYPPIGPYLQPGQGSSVATPRLNPLPRPGNPSIEPPYIPPPLPSPTPLPSLPAPTAGLEIIQSIIGASITTAVADAAITSLASANDESCSVNNNCDAAAAAATAGVLGAAAGTINNNLRPDDGCGPLEEAATFAIGEAADQILPGSGSAFDCNAAVDVARGSDIQDHVVLGRSLNVEKIAQQIGGRHLMGSLDYRLEVADAIANPNTKISVALDGVVGESTYSQIMQSVMRESKGVGTAFDWEMAQLYNAGRLPSVQFVREGKNVDNPF